MKITKKLSKVLFTFQWYIIIHRWYKVRNDAQFLPATSPFSPPWSYGGGGSLWAVSTLSLDVFSLIASEETLAKARPKSPPPEIVQTYK